MKHASTPGAGSIGMAAVAVALAATWACLPKATHRQSDAMAKAGTITVSAAELRALVNALADRFADQIEETPIASARRRRSPPSAGVPSRSRSTPFPPSTPRRIAPTRWPASWTCGRSPSRPINT